jgi:hypothetical protein
VDCRPRARGSRRAFLVTFAVLALLLGAPIAAAAHGSLVVPTARIEADGPTVTVTWSAAEDDAAAIAVGLGLLPRQVLLDHLAALAALPEDADPQPLVDELTASVDQVRLADEPRLDAYLLDTVVVTQDAVRCPGTAVSTDRFLTEGATLSYRCPAAVTEFDLTVTVLLEQDPTHRTFSSDGSGEVAIHSAATPSQTWSLTSTSPAGASAAGTSSLLVLAVGLLGTIVLGGAAFALVGRREADATPTITDAGAVREQVAP